MEKRTKKTKVTRDGIIFRQGKYTIVQVLGSKHAASMPGVLCLNPDEPKEDDRIYQKTFTQKPIYLPDSYDEFKGIYLSNEDSFILSMNGYSSINAEQCRRYGIQKGSYDAACEAVLAKAIAHCRSEFTGAKIQLIYGASDMGVDAAIEKVAKRFNLDIVGFSCPEYMLYVKDDKIPVFVGKNDDDYGDYYIKSLDLLIATGGREHALKHDVSATCIYGKRVHFVDILNSLSSTGGVPATIINAEGKVVIDNAAAAFGKNISFFNREDAVAHVPTGGDRWDAIFTNVNSVATEVCRSKMSPEKKFSY